MSDLPEHHVLVRFGSGVPYDVQCDEMMELEKRLRKITNKRIEVFANARGDDSRLRAMMTTEQRAKL